MSVQPLLPFADVPVTDPTQARYHAIAPCLAGKVAPPQQARLLNISYSTVSRWLKQFREEGMRGLFPAAASSREPYTPERIIVSLIYFKCCVPKASDRELNRVIGNITGHKLHNETVKSLLERYFFWRYREFQSLIVYPIFPMFGRNAVRLSSWIIRAGQTTPSPFWFVAVVRWLKSGFVEAKRKEN